MRVVISNIRSHAPALAAETARDIRLGPADEIPERGFGVGAAADSTGNSVQSTPPPPRRGEERGRAWLRHHAGSSGLKAGRGPGGRRTGVDAARGGAI